MQETPKALRLHIGIYGRRNVGKSSLLNALVRQDVAIVSPTPGTTTDPVEKTMELAPVGPVVFIDTAGIDDEGDLGAMRMERTRKALGRTDLALLVTEGPLWGRYEQELAQAFADRTIPYIVVRTKLDLAPVADVAEDCGMPTQATPPEGGVVPPSAGAGAPESVEATGAEGAAGSALPHGVACVNVSSVTRQGMDTLRALIARHAPEDAVHQPALLADLVPPGGVAVLVVPIDLGAPKGRIILPQVQAIRDLLDGDALSVVVKEDRLLHALDALTLPPALVVCDSQVVRRVVAETPASIPLTTFSILMARFKGDLVQLAQGAAAIPTLRPGDRVLIAESCSHHPLADDIGRVKLPRWLRDFAGGDLHIDVAAGKDLPDSLEEYRLVIQCGGCVTTRGNMLARMHCARAAGVPMTNYGLAISLTQGVLARVLEPFASAHAAFMAACKGG